MHPILHLIHVSIRVLCYWNRLVGDIVYILSGSRTYPKPRLRLLTLNQALPQGSQVTCITSQVTCITYITEKGTWTGWGVSHPTGTLQWNPLSAGQPIFYVYPKYRRCLLHQFSQSQCKLFNIMLFRLSRLFNAHVT